MVFLNILMYKTHIKLYNQQCFLRKLCRKSLELCAFSILKER